MALPQIGAAFLGSLPKKGGANNSPFPDINKLVWSWAIFMMVTFIIEIVVLYFVFS